MALLLRILKHRAAIALLILLAIAGALQLAAPAVIRTLAIHWLTDHGAAHPSIGSVRINPFSGTLVVHDLDAGPGLRVGRAAVNIDWWPLWGHQIYLWDVALDQATLELTQTAKTSWQVAGLNLPENGESSSPAAHGQASPWYVVLHRVSLKNVRIRLAGHDVRADIPIQSLDMHHAFLSGRSHQVLNTELRLGGASASALGYRLSGAGLLLQGQLVLPGPEAASDTIAARNTTLRLRALAIDTSRGQPVLTIGRARLSGLSAQAPGRIEAEDAEADSVLIHTPLAGAADASADRILAHGMHIGKQGGDLASLSVQGIKATDTARKVDLGSIADLSVNGVSLASGKQFAFTRLVARNIALPATADQSLGRVNRITATDASLADNRTRMGQLDIQGLNLNLLHDAHGLEVVNRLHAAAIPPAVGKPPAPTAPSSPADIGIGRLSIDKGSRIVFADNAVDPPFQGTLTVESFLASSLETTGNNTGTMDAAFRIGDQGKITIEGKMNANRANPAADLAIAVKRLNLPMLSGYLARDFGNTIGTGQMDLNSKIRIHDQVIDAQNKLAIRNLALNAARQSGKASQSIGMPLDMAVSMLRNDRGDISLNVPVKGRLDNPNVNINDAIDQALATAIQSGAMSYASLLLQPYGSILPAISLATDLIGYASRPRLTPLSFAPRSAALSPDAKAYIGKISELMKRKPFRLQVCGVTTRAEMEPAAKPGPVDKTNDRALLDLARTRSSAVVQSLVADGISPDRLFECLPKIDGQPKAGGRVELLLN